MWACGAAPCNRDRDLLARARRQRLSAKPALPLARHEIPSLRAPVVVEHRLDALLPFAALLRERVTQPDPRAQIKDVIRRDPRLRQPRDHQQLAQMPGVRAIVLGALLVPPPRGRLRRLSQMHHGAHPAQLLDHEPPARRRLQRDLELLVAEALNEPADPGAIRRRHTRARDLPGRRIDPVGGDLRSMLIESHYDRHEGPPQAPRLQGLRGPAPRLS
jgi:hypothetical protein